MNDVILITFASLSIIGIVAAAILYLVSKKFHVEENPKIDIVEEALPSANCGACGFAGCRAFAVSACEADKDGFEKMNCPVGGADVMKTVASILGFEAVEKEKTVVMLMCQGSKELAPKKNHFEGLQSCRLLHANFAGEKGCPTGCLGKGDCVSVCNFGALSISEKTGLPVVDEEKCTSCGACVNICPRGLFEVRPLKDKRVFVACKNTQKGGAAKKNCKVACIGCSKCKRTCDIDEIVVENNLSYISPNIDAEKYGADLVKCCPTNAIVGINIDIEEKG